MNNQPYEDREIYFTLKFYQGKKPDSTSTSKEIPFKFELDFNYPFNALSDFQSLERNKISIKPGSVKSSMQGIFETLNQFFDYIDNIAIGKVQEEREGEEKISNEDYRKIKALFSAVNNAENNNSVNTSINRISYTQFNPRELDISTNLSLAGNGDPRPPRR